MQPRATGCEHCCKWPAAHTVHHPVGAGCGACSDSPVKLFDLFSDAQGTSGLRIGVGQKGHANKSSALQTRRRSREHLAVRLAQRIEMSMSPYQRLAVGSGDHVLPDRLLGEGHKARADGVDAAGSQTILHSLPDCKWLVCCARATSETGRSRCFCPSSSFSRMLRAPILDRTSLGQPT